MRRFLTRLCCLLMGLSLFLLDLEVRTARAGMIGTEAVMALEMEHAAPGREAAFFEQEAVLAALAAHGVSPEEARARVATLSAEEAGLLAGAIDQLPAGGDSIIGAAVFVFLVLLVTDILGYTRVFPFVRPVR